MSGPALLLLLSSHRSLNTADTWPVVATASSLVLEGNWDLREFVANAPASYCNPEQDDLPYCILRTAKGYYSYYPSGMVQFAAPVCLVSRLVGGNLTDAGVRGRLEKWCAALVAALALGLFFLLALQLADPTPAWVATALLASGSVFFSTVGQGLWQHGGVILWSLVLLLVEFRSANAPAKASIFVQGLAAGLMVACRLSASVILVPFGVWVLLRAPRRRWPSAWWRR